MSNSTKPTSIKLLTIRAAGKENSNTKKKRKERTTRRISNEIYSPWINGKTYFFYAHDIKNNLLAVG